jgi:hypothetical protein
LKDILLLLANSFAIDIKASLVTGNPLFHKSLKYSKTEASISGFLPFLGPEKTFCLSDMQTVLFLYYATSRKVAGLIPDEVIGFFTWSNPTSGTMGLGSTQALTEMSTRNLPGGKGQLEHKAHCHL